MDEQRKNNIKLTRETTISVGLVITMVAIIGSGIFLAGRMTGAIDNNAAKIKTNRANIQSIKEDINGLPNRQEFQSLQKQVERTNESVEDIKRFLME